MLLKGPMQFSMQELSLSSIRSVLHDCNEFGLEDKKIPGDGVLTGYGLIDGRLVYSFLHDFTVRRGFFGSRIFFKSMQDNGSCNETGRTHYRDQ